MRRRLIIKKRLAMQRRTKSKVAIRRDVLLVHYEMAFIETDQVSRCSVVGPDVRRDTVSVKVSTLERLAV